ncbi:MAG TPA: TonB-dependent receptor [Pyrinomonadaceae bacterium]|nr:TonB-dependent receptor [Pyrinomonadaceae bacterium]
MYYNLRQNMIRFAFLTFCLCGLFAINISAQSINGKILGTVTDQNSAVVPNATVNIINEGTGAKRTLNADENGFYVFPELPVGFYTVEISGGSFALFTRKNVKVDVGGETRVDTALAAQGVTTTVDVTTDSTLIKTDSSTLSEVISSRQVDSLPLNGRDFRRLVTLTPGAAPRSQRGSLGSFTVNGQREKNNIFLIDGVDNNDSFRNQPSFNQGGVTGAPATLFPVDALGEFSLQTQGAAEYGRNSGAVVNIVVKSGTNDFHGTAYTFIRNDNFDARNFFEQTRNEFRNGNFGGVLGGPLPFLDFGEGGPVWNSGKNRTFFFVGYEGQREFVNSPFQVRVPSTADIAAARASNITAGRPENALSTRLLGLFPTANLGAATGNNYAFAAPNLNNSNNFLIKIDHRFSDDFYMNGRYIYGKGTQNFPLTSGNGSPLPEYQTVVPTKIQLFGLNFSNILSPTLFNEARIGYNRFEQTFTPLDAAFNPASLGLVTGSGLQSLPTITVTGLVSLGAPTNVPRGRVSSAFQLVDNVTWTRGSHTFKFGGEYRRAIVDSFADQNARGRINFNNLADFLAGVVSPNGTVLLRGDTRRETFTNNFGFFAQDDWKITSRLTLNLGLRYEYLGVLQEKENRLSNFLFDRGLVRVGESGLSSVWKPDYNNFAPRLGFAYDVFGKGKTIVRGAVGLYYDTPSQDYFLLQSFQNGGPGSLGLNPLPGLGVFNLTPTAPIPFGSNVSIFGAAAGGLPTSNIALFATDINQRTPYIFNYNANVQQQLFKDTVLQVSYVGSQGRKLYRVRDINQATPGPAATRQSRRPFNGRFPQYSFINYLEASASSNYNAFQANVRQRLTSGLNLNVSYTLSKSIDDASNGIYGGTRGVSFPQDSYNLKAERAVSSFDVRHRFTFNFVYDLNFLPEKFGENRLTEGWQLSGIYTASSGIPITPFLSADVSGTGELNDRPNLTGDPNSGPRTAGQWFNTAAFTIPAAGTFGNAPRNSIIGPPVNIFDFSLNKTTRIVENVSLQFRAEAFNLFNRPNFSLPNVDRNSSAFGAIGETPDVTAGNPRLGEGGPRVLQFGLKLIF